MFNRLSNSRSYRFDDPQQWTDIIENTLEQLRLLSADECLNYVAEKLREIINCESVTVLLWNDGDQILKTEQENGIPEGLNFPEVYKNGEGVTGSFIFEKGNFLLGKIDVEKELFEDTLTNTLLEEKSIKWNNIRAYKYRSKYNDFKSLLGAPLMIDKNKIGTIKLINKIDVTDQKKLDENGFSENDLYAVIYFIGIIEQIIASKIFEEQRNTLRVITRELTFDLDAGNDSRKMIDIVHLCAQAINCRLSVIRKVEGDRFRKIASNEQVSPANIDSIIEMLSRYAIKNACSLRLTTTSEPVLEALHHWDGTNPDSKNGSTWERILDERYLHSLPDIERRIGIRSMLIVPIMTSYGALGTIECGHSLHRQFSRSEVHTLANFGSFLPLVWLASRQQKLMNVIMNVHKKGLDARSGGNEDSIISDLITEMRDALHFDKVAIGVIFSRPRLERTSLQQKYFYGDKERIGNLLKCTDTEYISDKLQEKISEASQQAGDGLSINKIFISKDGSSYNHSGTDEFTPYLHLEPFTFSSDKVTLGWLVFGIVTPIFIDPFSKKIIELSVNYLGIILEQIHLLRKLRGIENRVEEAAKNSGKDIKAMYTLMLKEITSSMNFDYAAISHVDHVKNEVKTILGETNSNLVDPNDWMEESCYDIEGDRDILVDIVKKKACVTIYGYELVDAWDHQVHLNKQLFDNYNHKDLVRVFLPIILDDTSVGEQAEQIVIGVLEAGYHVSTKKFISKQQIEILSIFLSFCTQTLQRRNLMEEKRAVNTILNKTAESNKQAGLKKKDSVIILDQMLEESVRLAHGSFGCIRLLSHDKSVAELGEEPIVYCLNPDDERLRNNADYPVTNEVGQRGIIPHVIKTKEVYWSNDVSDDPLYLRVFDEVFAELVVPIMYHGEVFGVMNIQASKEKEAFFDLQKANLILGIANQAAILYQRVRMREMLSEMTSPFEAESTREGIFEKLLIVVEDILRTRLVSVWEKKITKAGINFQLQACDSLLQNKAPIFQNNNLMLSADGSVSALMEQADIKSHLIEGLLDTRLTLEEEGIVTDLLEDLQERILVIPIDLGKVTYGSILVFYKRDVELLSEEKHLLKMIASKAALALHSINFQEAFNRISELLVDMAGDSEDVLKQITESALEVLHANPVILYKYDDSKRTFSEPIRAGQLYHGAQFKDTEVQDRENFHFVRLMLDRDPLYLKNEEEYKEFYREVERKWENKYHDAEFWEREKIKSLAVVPLRLQKETVGVMFFNYRQPQQFSAAMRKNIQAFAAQAALAIVNAKLMEQRHQDWESALKLSHQISTTELVNDLAHNSKNVINTINLILADLRFTLKDNDEDKVSKEVINKFVEELGLSFNDLTYDFTQLSSYATGYRGAEDARLERCRVEDLVENTLSMHRRSFQRIEIKKEYDASQETYIMCNENQVQHALANLILNARDAVNRRGRISINISTIQDNEVRITISDNGIGIDKETRKKIFDLYFTTKTGRGTGVGLPAAKFLIEKHQGRIDFVSKRGKGSTFYIYLPLEKK